MKPNIIFILLDGSRQDRIKNSLEFSELLEEGTLLNNVSTVIPYTFGSINAILTGKYGKENGVDGYYKVSGLKAEVSILPEILQNNGYFTSRGLINDKILSPRGFDIREEFNEYETDLNIKHPQLIEDTFKKAQKKPFFTFLQFTRIHTVTVSEILKKFKWNDEKFYQNKTKNLQTYDQVFREAGSYAKIIVDTIKKLGILNNTILIFFTDHGTGIGERFGERNYGSFTYEETIRTFYLFMGYKIKKNNMSNSLQSTIDIFPTILDLCKIKINEKFLGKSFAGFLEGKSHSVKDRDFTFSETGALHGPYPSPEISNVFCIKSIRHKLIYLKDVNKWELYDLINDPNELFNLYGTKLIIENKLKEKLLEWVNRD
jgi:arylsulfatase A-like enzyme